MPCFQRIYEIQNIHREIQKYTQCEGRKKIQMKKRNEEKRTGQIVDPRVRSVLEMLS